MKQQKQQRRSENVKLRELVFRYTVHVLNHLYGQVKWALGTVYVGMRRYVHIDHIRSTSEVDESVISVVYLGFLNIHILCASGD